MVPTVTGTIPASALGRTFIHEHVTCADWSMRSAFGDEYFNRRKLVETAVGQYSSLKRSFGHGTVVDGTPINLGRDPELLREVSEKSGVYILISTGFFFIEQPQLLRRSEEELYHLMLREIRSGIADTGIRPAIIKCAVGESGFTPLIERLLAAAGRASADTGLPVFCHTTASERQGIRAADIFEAAGADPGLVVIGHSGDSNDIEYLESLLRRGFMLGMDRFCIADTTNSIENRIAVIEELHRRGWTDKLLLSGDRPIYGGFGSACDNGNLPDNSEHYMDIYTRAVPSFIVGGMTHKDIDRMLIENPRRLFENL